MNAEEQAELQSADLSFYPPLGAKTRESRDVHLKTQSGKTYRGILVHRGKVKMPPFVVLHNMPEISERQVVLSAETAKLLATKIRDRVICAAAGLL